MENVLKKTYLPILLLLVLSNLVMAQNIVITDSINLWFEFETPLTIPKLSPDGKFIAFSEDNLRDVYLSSTDSIVFERSIKAKSAGWQFRWSPDSKFLVTTGKPIDYTSPYDETYLYHLKINGELDTLFTAIDEMSFPFINKTGDKIYFQIDSKITKHVSLKESNDETPFALFSNEKLFIGGIDAEKVNFIPVTINKVILFLEWSPDFTKLAVHYAGQGIVVYDLSTKMSYQFPRSEYPSWLNNEYLIFMKVLDDGLKFIDADAYCAKFDNTTFNNLTESFAGMVFYPWASSVGTIVFVDQLGKIYKMKIKVE